MQRNAWRRRVTRRTPFLRPASRMFRKRGSIEATRSEGAEIRARFPASPRPANGNSHRMLARFAVGLDDESLPIKDVKSDDDEGEHPLLEEGKDHASRSYTPRHGNHVTFRPGIALTRSR